MPGYDVATLVEKSGKSASHIYARLALLQLIPAVAEAFTQERITASHANLIARLPQESQAWGPRRHHRRQAHSLCPSPCPYRKHVHSTRRRGRHTGRSCHRIPTTKEKKTARKLWSPSTNSGQSPREWVARHTLRASMYRTQRHKPEKTDLSCISTNFGRSLVVTSSCIHVALGICAFRFRRQTVLGLDSILSATEHRAGGCPFRSMWVCTCGVHYYRLQLCWRQALR